MLTLYQADSYASLLSNLLSSRITPDHNMFEGFPTTRVQLQSGTDYGVSIPTLNPVDANSVVNIVFQVCACVCVCVIVL